MPPEIKQGFEKSVAAKAEVISWLKRSLEAAHAARATETPKDLEKKVEFLTMPFTSAYSFTATSTWDSLLLTRA